MIISETSQPFHFLIPVHAEQRGILRSFPALQPSRTHQGLNRSDCNQARMLKGQRPPICGIGTAGKAALGALQSQIDVVQCAATVHSVKCFTHIWTASLKS